MNFAQTDRPCENCSWCAQDVRIVPHRDAEKAGFALCEPCRRKINKAIRNAPTELDKRPGQE